MAKVAKIGLLVFAVAVNVVPGLGQAISIGIFGSTFFALSYGIVAVTLAATAIGVAVSQSLAKKPSVGATGATSRVNLDPNAPQFMIAGQFAGPTQLIYFATAGSNNEQLSMIFVHSCYPITGFVSLAIGNVSTSFPTPTGAYAGVLSIQTTDGSQTANPFTGVIGSWGSTHIGRGLAMSHFRWTYDKDKLASGLPQNIQWVMKGAPVYDPRRDSTRGGSGSHRANDQTTWQYAVGGTDIGRNSALFELSYRLGWRKNGRLAAGMGEDPANLDMASYIASANVCEETVNGKPRYRFDAIVDIGPNAIHNDNLAKIHASCAGRPTDTGGLIGLWVANDDTATSVMTLTDDDLVGPVAWEPLPEGEVRNTGRGVYVSPTDFYQAKSYPEVAPADLRALDNGQELADGLDFGGVVDVDQARRLVSIRLRESRQGRLEVPVAMRALGLKPMKIVSITRPRFGWSNRKFRVEKMGIAIDKVNLTLRAVQAADYADVANTSLTTPASLQTIGYIPVLGVLALRDNVDFATQVVGAAKPANNADVTAAALASTGIPNTTVVAGTGQTLQQIRDAAFSGGGGSGVGPIAVVVGTSVEVNILGPVTIEAQYTGIATGAGTVIATLSIQTRVAGGSWATVGSSDVQSGTVGDSFTGGYSAGSGLASGQAGQARTFLSMSSGDGLNLSQPDSYWTAN